MRVFAVAHFLHFFKMQVQGGGIRAARRVLFVRSERSEIIGDRTVVLRGVREYFFGQRELGFIADFTLVGVQLGQHRRVIGRIANDDHVLVVLGRRTQHGRTADVDVFDRVFQLALVFGHGLLERIQVHHDQIDGRDAVLFQGLHVFRKIAPRQDPAMHLRMQRLDAAVQHFREAGVIGDFGHLHAIVGQHLGGAAGRKNFDAQRRQRAREIEYTRLVGDGNQGLFDHDEKFR